MDSHCVVDDTLFRCLGKERKGGVKIRFAVNNLRHSAGIYYCYAFFSGFVNDVFGILGSHIVVSCGGEEEEEATHIYQKVQRARELFVEEWRKNESLT